MGCRWQQISICSNGHCDWKSKWMREKSSSRCIQSCRSSPGEEKLFQLSAVFFNKFIIYIINFRFCNGYRVKWGQSSLQLPLQQKTLHCAGHHGHLAVPRAMEVCNQGEVLRVRRNKESATKNPVTKHGHHGPHVAQHVDQVYRPEQTEEELRRGTVP